MRVRGGHAGLARPRLTLLVAGIAIGTLLLFSATRAVPAARAVPVARATVSGTLLSGHRPSGNVAVDLYATPGRAAGGAARLLARGVTSASGSFSLVYTRPESHLAVGYIVARTGRTARAATALGPAPFPRHVVVNERTTVATAYALAQFIVGDRIEGKAPGLQNGAAMVRDFVTLRTGGLSSVLSRAPNGPETSTLPTFNSLANLVAGCARSVSACPSLLRLARVPGEPAPRGVLSALSVIARNPWHNVVKLFRLARTSPMAYRPALRATQAPDAWTLALRFVGDGKTMSGPGNMAIDARGNVWSTNNYVYSRDPAANVCGAQSLLKFTPTGRYVSGSPYYGGGLNGAGFGITLDPLGRVWVGNFGFSAVKCKAQPPHNSVSAFTPAGRPISPSATDTSTGGFTQGDIWWPQGTVSDRQGNIWMANCGNDSITRYAAGNPAAARSIPLPIAKPFDIAFNLQGQAFVTGDGDSAVEMLNPDGTYALPAPITGGGLNKPMGIAADIEGNMWVANSGFADVPCPSGATPPRNHPASITLITSTGRLASRQPFTGGGLTAPWGVAVDGQDHVWVSNFGGQRLSEFCGVERAKCPRGMGTGQPISPSTGYGFDGLVRNTGVQVDPSGNVWLANNWKTNPLPRRNPGGYQMVVFVGLAGPLRTPLIGPPNPL